MFTQKEKATGPKFLAAHNRGLLDSKGKFYAH